MFPVNSMSVYLQEKDFTSKRKTTAFFCHCLSPFYSTAYTWLLFSGVLFGCNFSIVIILAFIVFTQFIFQFQSRTPILKFCFLLLNCQFISRISPTPPIINQHKKMKHYFREFCLLLNLLDLLSIPHIKNIIFSDEIF